jgi:hypothetical protein
LRRPAAQLGARRRFAGRLFPAASASMLRFINFFDAVSPGFKAAAVAACG